MIGFDAKAWCESIRGMKPPFECPIRECGKIYKSFAGIEQHVYTHSSDPVQHDSGPLSPSSPTAFVRKPFDFPLYAGAQKVIDIELNGEVHQLNVESSLSMVNSDDFGAENGLLKGAKQKKVKGRKDSVDGQAKVDPFVSQLSQDVKLPEPSYRCVDNLCSKSSQPVKKFLGSAYIKYADKIGDELERDSEYDMDEEDASWLQLVNKQRKQGGLAEISESTFEGLIDRLEKEAFFQHQASDKSSVSRLYEDNAMCSICQSGECQNANVILFCDMCNIAVHQECYGVPYIPEGQWLCRRCLHSPSRAVTCCLCPNGGGAFKQTDDGRWAHVVCALWVPEVGFSNAVFLEPIDGIARIPPARWKLKCFICKQRGNGACIQCHKPNCYVSFHVTCAQLAGLYMKIEAMRGVGPCPTPAQVRKTAYCDVHSMSLGGGPMIDSGDDEDSKVKASHEQAEKSKMKIRLARKLLAERRNVPPVVSVPTIKPERLDRIANGLAMPKKTEFVRLLAGYWTLKRQSRNGVPLLRRLQSYNQNKDKAVVHGDEELSELRRRHQDIRRVRQEMEKVRLLLELVRKREKLKRELLTLHLTGVEMKINRLQVALRRIVDELTAADVKNALAKPVTADKKVNGVKAVELVQVRERVESGQYDSVGEFLADLHAVFKTCRHRHSRNAALLVALTTLQDQFVPKVEELRDAFPDVEAGDVAGSSPCNSSPIRTKVVKGKKSAASPGKKAATVSSESDIKAPVLTNQNEASSSGSGDVSMEQQLSKLIDKLDTLDQQRPSDQMKLLQLLRKEVRLIKKAVVTTNNKKQPTDNSRANAAVNGYDSPQLDIDDNEDSAVATTTLPLSPPTNSSKKAAKSKPKANTKSKRPAGGADLGNSAAVAAAAVVSKVEPIVTSDSSNNNVPKSKTAAKKGKVPAKLSLNNSVTDSGVVSTSGANSSVKTVKSGANSSAKGKKRAQSPAKTTKVRHVEINSDTENEYDSDDMDETSTRTTFAADCSTAVNGGDVTDNSAPNSPAKKRRMSSVFVDDVSLLVDTFTEKSHQLWKLRLSIADGDSASSVSRQTAEDSDVSVFADGDNKLRSYNEAEVEVRPGDIVWAKCAGYAWYPALVIDPSGKSAATSSLPQPSDKVLAEQKKYDECVFLVMFFDGRTSWQWLPRKKLVPLGLSADSDRSKLLASKERKTRKGVLGAYRRAVTHCLTTTGDHNLLARLNIA